MRKEHCINLGRCQRNHVRNKKYTVHDCKLSVSVDFDEILQYIDTRNNSLNCGGDPDHHMVPAF